uniref:Uncharacterized protein n=1 Tax=Sipha flava TaxID=143950 RepID=A0A2S2Q227_9HEMI
MKNLRRSICRIAHAMISARGSGRRFANGRRRDRCRLAVYERKSINFSIGLYTARVGLRVTQPGSGGSEYFYGQSRRTGTRTTDEYPAIVSATAFIQEEGTA